MPIIFSSGSIRRKVSSFPPHMTVSVPSIARASIPDIGQSMNSIPVSAQPSATSIAAFQLIVLRSASTAPFFILEISPFGPSAVFFTISPLGRQRKITPASQISSVLPVVFTFFSPLNFARFDSFISNTVSSSPPFARFIAIGAPIFPRPAKEIFITLTSPFLV